MGANVYFPFGVELWGSEDWYVSNINLVLKWDSRFIFLLNTAKLPIISKNCSNKSYWELSFVQKSHWAHMSISPRSGTRRLIFLNFWVYTISQKLFWNFPSVSFRISWNYLLPAPNSPIEFFFMFAGSLFISVVQNHAKLIEIWIWMGQWPQSHAIK